MCVQLLRTVDYVVAVGTSAGVVTFFQMPSILPGGNNQVHLNSILSKYNYSIIYNRFIQTNEKLITCTQNIVY